LERRDPLTLLLDLPMLLKDLVDLDLERAHTYPRTCETVLLQVVETEWVAVNTREMIWLLFVSQT
jgi:hypothetical protein